MGATVDTKLDTLPLLGIVTLSNVLLTHVFSMYVSLPDQLPPDIQADHSSDLLQHVVRHSDMPGDTTSMAGS